MSSLLLAGLLGGALLQAQTPAAPAVSGTTHKTTHRHARSAKTRKSAKAAQPPALATPPEPPKPNWPVNDKAAPAAVTWDSRGLSIQAKNSSLQQILEDVATATGAKLEGTVADQRVFGVYGPGQARDVLIQLLQGSGYNVLMIGDQDRGAPSRIVLTARSAGGQQTSANRAAQNIPDEDAADSEPEEPPQPPVTPPILRPGFGPGTPMRPPQPMPQQVPPGMTPPNR
ncbi:MAG: hypothetical protein KGM96_13145 [Acidobacteriota bacterium]|nr:hypothetical protein [Acidobacteriota bacterium]